MPKRQSMRRVKSDLVQGEGSYIDMRQIPYGMIADARKMKASGEVDEVEYTRDLVNRIVAGWNWVDDDGNPLPPPGEDPDVIDRLLASEVACIVQQVQNIGSDLKN